MHPANIGRQMKHLVVDDSARRGTWEYSSDDDGGRRLQHYVSHPDGSGLVIDHDPSSREGWVVQEFSGPSLAALRRGSINELTHEYGKTDISPWPGNTQAIGVGSDEENREDLRGKATEWYPNNYDGDLHQVGAGRRVPIKKLNK